jgi:hypothetical protein
MIIIGQMRAPSTSGTSGGISSYKFEIYASTKSSAILMPCNSSLNHMAFMCPVCSGSILSWESIERAVSNLQPYPNGIEDLLDLFCSGITCPAVIVRIIVEKPVPNGSGGIFYTKDCFTSQWWQSNQQQANARTATAAQAAQQYAAQQFAQQYNQFHRPSPWSQYQHPPQQQTQQQQGNQQMPQIKIWWDVSVSAYRVATPYNKQFVDLIKSLIPGSDRAYDPTSKMWTVTEKYLGPLQLLCENVWKTKADVVTKQEAEKAQGASSQSSGSGSANGGRGQEITLNTNSIDLALARFMKIMPYDALQKAYRLAALELHPDAGGDMAKMAELNSLWTRIKKEHFKKD